MGNAVWAVWFHEVSTYLHPQHAFCPKVPQLWHEHRCAEVEGKVADNKHPLPTTTAIMKEIKPIFKNLYATELLRRCLKGGTQN
jgi:hypothetical protein